jgi:preprotein translocase subunit SecE
MRQDGTGARELRPDKPANKRNFVNNLTKTLIWVAIIGTAFALLWWKGYLVRLANYVRETREELRKCTWPSWEELKGSTVVVAISIALIGLFTVAVDIVFVYVLNWVYKV